MKVQFEYELRNTTRSPFDYCAKVLHLFGNIMLEKIYKNKFVFLGTCDFILIILLQLCERIAEQF